MEEYRPRGTTQRSVATLADCLGGATGLRLPGKSPILILKRRMEGRAIEEWLEALQNLREVGG